MSSDSVKIKSEYIKLDKNGKVSVHHLDLACVICAVFTQGGGGAKE